MNRTRILFFLGLIGMTFMIVRCNSTVDSVKPVAQPRREPPSLVPPPAASATPAPAVAVATPQPTVVATSAVDFQKVAQSAAPSVVLISAFDEKGKLLRTGSGCFISDDGRIVTSAALTQGAANAIARASDGKIYNVAGILGEAAGPDVAVLKAETKNKVPFLTPNKSVVTETGARVGIVGSMESKRKPPHIEGSVTAKSGESLDVHATIPAECVGAPVVNERGELLGIVTSRHAGDATVVRGAAAIENVIARIDPDATVRWAINPVTAPPPPAEGPTGTPKPKVPLAGQGQSRLVYSPKPSYPLTARMSHFPVRGTGKYRVTFDEKGEVRSVEIVQSARSDSLDAAATDALRRWKATPGQPWSATVPITFQP